MADPPAIQLANSACAPSPYRLVRLLFSARNDDRYADSSPSPPLLLRDHGCPRQRVITFPRCTPQVPHLPYLATRPLLMQHDRAALIVAHDVERVLTDINADYGDCGIELLRHGVLLVFGAPGQLKTLAGQEHGRTIPLVDIGRQGEGK